MEAVLRLSCSTISGCLLTVSWIGYGPEIKTGKTITFNCKITLELHHYVSALPHIIHTHTPLCNRITLSGVDVIWQFLDILYFSTIVLYMDIYMFPMCTGFVENIYSISLTLKMKKQAKQFIANELHTLFNLSTNQVSSKCNIMLPPLSFVVNVRLVCITCHGVRSSIGLGRLM